ncbi:MAG: BON domain-containing protein [Sulfuricella sp.]|nr:BON domain-containing protein [Sulfuricella sp.]
MDTSEAVTKQIHAAFERETRIDLHHHPIAMAFDNGVLTLEGDVADIAAKKLALELGGAAHGVRGVVDRLRVIPAEHRGDGDIRVGLGDFLLEEPTLSNVGLRAWHKGQGELLREADSGRIELAVEDGVVTLDGEVISLSHKRLAGVLAWWTPGCRDVINGLEVAPPEEDSDDEVVDAVRLVLEKDPLVHAEQIRASARDYVVTLEGLVGTPDERKMAELDAWYVFAVNKVINRLEVA